MKKWIQSFLEMAAIILCVPHLFIYLYFFHLAFIRGAGWDLMITLSSFALTVSRISAPFLFLLFLGIRYVNRKRPHVGITFLICLASGYAGVLAWNLSIFPIFAYSRSIVPILLCSAGAVFYLLHHWRARPDGGMSD